MAKRVLLAINARARRGPRARESAATAFRARGHTVVEVNLDAAPGALSRAIVAHRDGTLLGAIDGLIETKLPLAIIPLGTVNDLARTLGVTFDPAAVAALVEDGATVTISVGSVNGVRYFNEASVGLSARIARLESTRLKRVLGKLVIPIATLRALRWMRWLHLEIESNDGSKRLVRALQLTVANNYRFGGVVENPEASLEEGTLWLYAIDVQGWWDALAILFSIAVHRLPHAPRVATFRAERFRVRSTHGHRHRVFADGEAVTALPAEFTRVPRAVTVFVPRSRVPSIR